MFLVGAVTLLLLPQLALASVGGWLGRTYRIVVERRIAGKEQPLPEVAGGADHIRACLTLLLQKRLDRDELVSPDRSGTMGCDDE